MREYIEQIQQMSHKQLVLLLAKKKQEETAPLPIVGYGFRFPGNINNIEKLWQSMTDKAIHIIDYPEGPPGTQARPRWNPQSYGNQLTLRHGAYLESLDALYQMDNMQTDEATYLDPQQRLLMQCCHEAMASAGLPLDALANKKVGIFIGISTAEFFHASLHNQLTAAQLSPYMGTGIALSATAGRLAMMLGSQGPTLAIDTACSSGLSALHTAKNSLRRGECDWALVGVSHLLLSPFTSLAFEQAGMLSPDGQSRPFDMAANGHVRGEGVGVILLTKKSIAENEKLNIKAWVKGSAIHQQGNRPAMSASTGKSQQHILCEALEDAGLTTNDIDYIEAHAVGNKLGAQIEIESLRAVYDSNKYDSKKNIYVGSAKANWGHLETASGLLSVMKTIALMQHREIPPQTAIEQLDECIDQPQSHIQVNLQPVSLSHQLPIRCGISSFGFTGTNAHVILESNSAANIDDRNSSSQSSTTIPTTHLWPTNNVWK
ncbi:polyketide synthase [Aliikangiella maris]|uniref:Polyketide synthase n=2 Tax=Aliikangiella maris TaxID=3162458 RepID=A0ABV2BRR7_9GAMM